MKKLSVISFILLLSCFTFTSCSSVDSQNGNELQLRSEKGYVLANDFKSLKNGISNIIEKRCDVTNIKEGLVINSVNYQENDNFSFAVVDASYKKEKYSVLVPIHTADNYIILIDKEGVRFVKIREEAEAGEKKLFSGSKLGLENENPIAAVCVGGDCCNWQAVTEAVHYNCACSSNTSADIANTSENCKIKI